MAGLVHHSLETSFKRLASSQIIIASLVRIMKVKPLMTECKLMFNGEWFYPLEYSITKCTPYYAHKIGDICNLKWSLQNRTEM